MVNQAMVFNRLKSEIEQYDVDATAAKYRAAGLEGERGRVVPFIRDMSEPYAWCDLVVCRAGATSISELAAVGCPAILIPFPHATDDHQTANARALVDVEAGWLIPQSELTPEALADRLESLLNTPARLETAAAQL